MSYIPYGKQAISQQDIDAVVDVLKSDWLTQGPVVPAFENAVAKACQAEFGVAVSNGTAALHLVCLALGLTQGHILWTSPNTFVASSNCALYTGADVDFVDIDLQTGNMSVEALATKLKDAEKSGNIPDVLMVVHFAGQSCQMAEIQALCKPYDIAIVEDASHALGAKYRGKPVGSCQYSCATILSFHPVKMITAAEGGMILTNDIKLKEKLIDLRSHGVTRDKDRLLSNEHGEWYYEQQDLGFNYRLSDIHAALGVSQLERLPDFVAARNQIAQAYDKDFIDSNVKPLWVKADCLSSYHIYVVTLPNKASRDKAYKELKAANIGVNLHYIPVYLQPFYQDLGFEAGICPNAESYYDNAITLPLFPHLTDEQRKRVVSTLLTSIESNNG